MNDVTLAGAKAHLSELVEQAAGGDPVRITRRGKPVAQLTAIGQARKPISLSALRALTEAIPKQRQAAGKWVRRLRDQARY